MERDTLITAFVGAVALLLFVLVFTLRPATIPDEHPHEMLEVEGVVPTVTLMATKDSVSGWNLHIMTTDFTFSPEQVGGVHVVGRGHAHVYVNGEKVARVYGPWYHLGALSVGHHEVSVTLNANSHETLAYEGRIIKDVVTVHEDSDDGHTTHPH